MGCGEIGIMLDCYSSVIGSRPIVPVITMKYTLEMTRPMRRIIDQLVLDLNVDTRAEVFNKAIALLVVAQDAKKEGKTLAIVEAGQIKADLIMD